MFAAEFNTSSSLNQSNTQTPITMKTLNNTVRLIGNLGFDPEVREIAKDRKVARMSVATNESYRNAAGERITNTQWHTVVAWGGSPSKWNGRWRRAHPYCWKDAWYTAVMTAGMA